MLKHELDSGEDAPARARRVVETLEDRLPGRVVFDLKILVSELVANSVRHSGAPPGEPIDLLIRVEPAQVRVEVADHGPGFDARAAFETTQQGLGLKLLDRLSDRWGSMRDHRGQVVWFEMEL